MQEGRRRGEGRGGKEMGKGRIERFLKDDYIIDMYNFLLHSVCRMAGCAHDKPFMDVQHFNGIVKC